MSFRFAVAVRAVAIALTLAGCTPRAEEAPKQAQTGAEKSARPAVPNPDTAKEHSKIDPIGEADLESPCSTLKVLAVDEAGAPLRADIIIRGKKLGTTDGTTQPISLFLPASDEGRKITVKVEGYAPFEKAAHVICGETQDIRAELSAEVRKSLSCEIFVGGMEVPLQLDPQSHMLTATNSGFEVSIFSRVQPEDDMDFSMFQVDLEKAGRFGKPVARSTGTIDGLAKFEEREVLHFMNHSREDEVVVRCEPK